MTKQFIVRLKKTDGTIVANSQIITVNGIGSGTILASDFTDGLLTGPVSTTNRSGSFVKTIAAPSVITYSITANVSSVNEPGTIQWTIAASGGTVTYPRTFQTIGTNLSAGINASDFSVAAGDPNWQEETVTMTGVGSLVLPFTYTQTILADTVTEGAETFQVSLYSWPGTSGAPTGANTLVATSSVITINDTSTSLTITYPTTSTHGTPFTWSISGAGANQTWYAQTSGAFTARVPNTGTLAVDGSGAASYTNGDWGTIGPGLTNNYGAVTVTFYFTGGPTITKPHTVSQAASPTPTPTPTRSQGSTPTPTPTPTRSQGSTPTPTPSPTPTPTPTPTQSQIVSLGVCGKSYHLMIGNGTQPWSAVPASGMLDISRDFNPTANISQSSLDESTFGSNVSVPFGYETMFYVVEWEGTFTANATGTYSFSGVADDWFMMWIGPNASSGYTENNTNFRAKTNESSNTGTFVGTAGTAYPFRAIYGNGIGSRGLTLNITPPGGSASTDWSPYLSGAACTLPAFSPSSIRFFGVATNVYVPPNGEDPGFTHSPGNRLGFSSTSGVTRIIVKARGNKTLLSTTGVTYDSIGGVETIAYDSSNVPELAPDGETGVMMPTGAILSPTYVLTGLVQGSWDHPNGTDNKAGISLGTLGIESEEPPGTFVVGFRLFVYTNASPYPTAGFTTSSTSTPVTDYIRLNQ